MSLSKSELVELATLVAAELREVSSVEVRTANGFNRVPVRVVDSGLISSDTHNAFEAAEAAMNSAANFDELKAATLDVTGIVRTILMGHKGN